MDQLCGKCHDEEKVEILVIRSFEIGSGVGHFYRRHHKTKTYRRKFDVQIADFYKGLQNTIADERAVSGTKLSSGKDPLPFSLYVVMGGELLKCKKMDSIVGRTFLILSWNLICRSVNTAEILFRHMGWKDDHMWICFPHSKTDQVGERNEPKSIYANPICPAICPILAMGVYLLSHTPDSRKLFPGVLGMKCG